MMKTKFCVLGLGIVIAMVSCLTGCGSSNGASSYEDAIDDFYAALEKEDIDAMKKAMAPEEVWDRLEEINGLPDDKMFAKVARCESVNELSERLSKWAENICDLKIKGHVSKYYTLGEEYDMDDLSDINKILTSASIDDMIDMGYMTDETDNCPIVDCDGYVVHYQESGWYFYPEGWRIFAYMNE